MQINFTSFPWYGLSVYSSLHLQQEKHPSLSPISTPNIYPGITGN